jgi:hypothetical protein
MQFSSSKCEGLLKDWIVTDPVLTIGGQCLEIMNESNYLGSCVGAGGNLTKEVWMRISEACFVFTNLKYLWHRRVVSLTVKDSV